MGRWPAAALLLMLMLSLLVACGSNPPAPIEDRNRRTPGDGRYYYVQRGDTLYSIAFRYGLDYRRVAAANRIPAPYTIYPGQPIVLKEGDVPPPPAKKPAPTRTAKAPTPAPKAPVPAPAPAPKSSAPAAVTKPSQSKSTTVSLRKEPVYTGSKVSAWRWPATGRLTRSFSPTVHKGIDIGGKRGDPVMAVAAGRVVYAGTGIVGFGELLIVKHNEVYLSAYGHNDALLVKEGQLVKAGQVIARKGSSGTDTVKLHFEIRKEGKPVDPMKLLPRS